MHQKTRFYQEEEQEWSLRHRLLLNIVKEFTIGEKEKFLGFGVVTTKTYGGLEEQGFVIHQSHVKEYETNYTSNDFYVNYNDYKGQTIFL